MTTRNVELLNRHRTVIQEYQTPETYFTRYNDYDRLCVEFPVKLKNIAHIYHMPEPGDSDSPCEISTVERVSFLKKFIGLSNPESIIYFENFNNSHKTLKLYQNRSGNSILLQIPDTSNTTTYKYMFIGAYKYKFRTSEEILEFGSIYRDHKALPLGKSTHYIYFFKCHTRVLITTLLEYTSRHSIHVYNHELYNIYYKYIADSPLFERIGVSLLNNNQS